MGSEIADSVNSVPSPSTAPSLFCPAPESGAGQPTLALLKLLGFKPCLECGRKAVPVWVHLQICGCHGAPC